MGYTHEVTLNFQAFLSGQSPADSTSYLIGNNNVLTTSGMATRIYMPRSGIIRNVYISWINVTVDASAEDTTLVIRKNNTTDSATGYTGSFANAQSPQTFNANLSVVKGDYIHLKLVTPAWVTNPTGTGINATIEMLV